MARESIAALDGDRKMTYKGRLMPTPNDKILRGLCELADWAEPILAAQELVALDVERERLARRDGESSASAERDRVELLRRCEHDDVTCAGR